MSLQELALTALQAALGLVLLGAGGAKLADLRGFSGTLVGLGLPRRWGGPTAWGTAITELGLGGLFLAGIAPRVVSVLVFSLAFGFVAVTAAAARWRPQVQCRCFGALAESGFGRTTLLRSVVLAVAAGMVAGVGTAPIEYGGTATGLLLALGALFALGCAAAANAIALMRKGAASR